MKARALVAEGLGTALLVAIVVGSGIMAQRLTDDVALALLANSLATGAGLYVLITVFAPVSGAQFNPVVTLFLRRAEAWPLRLATIAVQIAGGILGTWVAHAMFGLDLIQTSQTLRLGPNLWLAEGVATAGLMLVILGSPAERIAQSVALWIVAAYWFTASTSFANPAVTLARALTDTFAGIRPLDAPAFIAAQLIGGLAGAALGRWLFRRD
jgi:glycerol uptake facilitator-like aquaporin